MPTIPEAVRPVCLAAFLLVTSASGPVAAQVVTGQVVDAQGQDPIAGAVVRVQARPDLPSTVTDANGQFTLDVSGAPAIGIPVAAALEYLPQSVDNYETEVVLADAGEVLQIALRRIPATDNPNYQPPDASACAGCHTEQYAQWQQSNHSRAGINPRVRDIYSGDGTGSPSAGEGYVFTALHDPDDSGLCAVCHSANENPDDPGSVRFNEVSTVAGQDGVTCTTCHQLHSVEGEVTAIHLLGNSEFRFPQAIRNNGQSATHEHVWGPLGDVEFQRMRPAWYPAFGQSRLCASCHEYVTPASGAPGQTTYSEWLGSPAAAAGLHCQDCHMPAASQAGSIAAGVGTAPIRPPEQRHHHGFPGVYSGLLPEPIALRLEFDPFWRSIEVTSEVENRVLGHNWPTGVDVRNAFVVLSASLEGQPLTPRHGDTLPFWTSDAVPGRAEGDYDGLPGRGYAKLLSGRINGLGDPVAPVPFIDAEEELANSMIPPGSVDIGHYGFSLPEGVTAGDVLEIEATVIYRRAWRALAVEKGWTGIAMDEPWEREVIELGIQHVLTEDDLERVFTADFEF